MSVKVLKYRAFLSYAHLDVKWGKWLHNKLEKFRIDQDLVGRDTIMGPVPKTLHPIFRDREDFTGGHTLTEATIIALDQSAALIVVCSAASATRPAVNEEVRLFRHRHPLKPIIPVVIDGTYPDNFPPALRFEIELDGTVSNRPYVLLGPDLRYDADGRILGISKIVAGLIGVSTDEIVRRAERQRRRTLQGWIVGLSAVTFALAGLTIWAEFNRREAITQRKLAESNFAAAKDTVDGLIYNIVQGLRNVEGMSVKSIESILETAQKTVEGLVAKAPDNLEIQRSRSVMLHNFGDIYVKSGSSRALSAYEESLAIIRKLAKAKPEEAKWQRDVWVTLTRLADFKETHGDIVGALAAFDESLAIARALAKNSRQPRAQVDLSFSLNRLGDYKIKAGHADAAIAAYQESLSIVQTLAKVDTENIALQRDVSISLNKIGDLKLSAGDTQGASENYQESLAIRRRIHEKYPNHNEFGRDLSISLEKVGDIKLAGGNLAEALGNYEESLSIAQKLARFDTGNAGFEADTSEMLTKLADLRLRMGNNASALTTYQEALSIVRNLVAHNPDNTEWRYNMYAIFARMGYVKQKINDIAGAQAAYEEGVNVIRKLAAIDRTNSNWQQEFLKSLETLGDFRMQIGDPQGALAAFEEGFAVAKNLQSLSGAGAPELQSKIVAFSIKVARTSSDLPRNKKLLECALAILNSFHPQDAEKVIWKARWKNTVEDLIRKLSSRTDLQRP
jgi:tetratricopeptide (TPR) repeat protein